METNNELVNEKQKLNESVVDDENKQFEVAKKIGKSAFLQALTTAAASWLVYQVGQTFMAFGNVVKRYKEQKKESE